MQTSDILPPLFAMMLLTLLVWVYMYARRLAYLGAQRIDAQALTTPEKLNALLPESVNNASNNLKNLFELPVLFYAVCLYLYASHGVGALDVYCAWAFVALRTLHSVVHCSVNTVLLRFGTHFLAATVLWTMVVRAALLAFATA
jgi:hypothetical protein